MSEEQYPRVINLCGSEFVSFVACQLNRPGLKRSAYLDIKAHAIVSINQVVVESTGDHPCLNHDHASINTLEGRSLIVHHSREDILEAMRTETWK